MDLRGTWRAVLGALVSLVLFGSAPALLQRGASAQGPVPPGARAAPAATATPLPVCGLAWRQVDSPNAGAGNSFLRAVAAVSPTDIWAVGDDVRPDGFSNTLIEHWDGAAWTIVPSPSPGRTNLLYGVAAIRADDVWAVGAYVADGVPFQAVAALAAADAWAVGADTDAQQGGFVPLIAHWDGSTWSLLPSERLGSSELNAIAVHTASDIWAVGDSENAPGIYPPIVEHWDGANWRLVPAGEPVDFTMPNGVTAPAADDVWMVGVYSTDSGNRTYIAHYSDPHALCVADAAAANHRPDRHCDRRPAGPGHAAAADCLANGHSDPRSGGVAHAHGLAAQPAGFAHERALQHPLPRRAAHGLFLWPGAIPGLARSDCGLRRRRLPPI